MEAISPEGIKHERYSTLQDGAQALSLSRFLQNLIAQIRFKCGFASERSLSVPQKKVFRRFVAFSIKSYFKFIKRCCE